MSRISSKTFKKICENVLQVLYDNYPIAFTTTRIAEETARDNEFILKVLTYLQEKGFVVRVESGKEGEYQRWMRWKLSKKAKEHYTKKQDG